jgi:hypothetical protein
MTDASKASTAHHPPILSNMQASSSNTILSSFRTFNDNIIDNDNIINNNSYQGNNSDDPAASTAFVTLSNRRSSSIPPSSSIIAAPITINSFATSSSNRASSTLASSSSFHATQLVSMHSGLQLTPGEAAAGAQYLHDSDNYRYSSRVSAQVIHALSDKISEQLMDLEEVLAERHHHRCVSSSSSSSSSVENTFNHGNSSFSHDDKDADDATHRSCIHVTNPSSPVLLPSQQDQDQQKQKQVGVEDDREATILDMKEDDNIYGSKGEDVHLDDNSNSSSSSAFHLSIYAEHLSPGHVLRSQSASPSRNSQSNSLLPLLPSPVSTTMNDDVATGSCCSLKVQEDMPLPSSSSLSMIPLPSSSLLLSS